MKTLFASIVALTLLAGTTAASADLVGVGVHVGGIGVGAHIGGHHRGCRGWGYHHHHRYCRGWY
jgi:hypothetical protein